MLIPALPFPDADDRHVLAAAVRCNADVIVTSNLRDFPASYLQQFDIEPQHPDRFITYLIDINPDQAIFPGSNSILNVALVQATLLIPALQALHSLYLRL